MGELFRRARGLVGVGMTWGVLWAMIGGIVGFVLGVLDPSIWTWSNPVLEWGFGIGLYGLVSGIGFGTVLALRGARKSLFDLSLPRVAFWGVVGSALVPFFFGTLGMFDASTTLADIMGAVLLTSGLGGLSAPTAVGLARKAALSAGEGPSHLGGGYSDAYLASGYDD